MVFAISTTEDGMCVGTPDVCCTPPYAVPIPYVNIATCRMALLTESDVLVRNKPVLTEESFVPMSWGDEPGSLGGVRSGRFVGPCTFKTTSATVYAKKKKVVIHGSLTGQNGFRENCIGTQTTPSQSDVYARS